MQASPGLANSL